MNVAPGLYLLPSDRPQSRANTGERHGPALPPQGSAELVFLRAGMTCLTHGKLPTAFETQASVYIKMQEAILKEHTN